MSGPPTDRRVEGLDVVADRTATSRCDDGFLKIRRLVLRSRYAGGGTSEEYDYDVISRRQPDAVAVVVHGVDDRGRTAVVLRRGVRPPVGLRPLKDLVQPDERTVLEVVEVPAGLLEEEDRGPGGVERAAAREVREETGYVVDPEALEALGGPLFPSPGVTDEKVHFRVARVDLARRGPPEGDGSVIERDSTVLVLPLDEVLRRFEAGELTDMKTEVALRRFADRARRARPDPSGPSGR